MDDTRSDAADEGQHGIYQRHVQGCARNKKCGCPWWIRYADEHGCDHRESIGAKSLAVKVYQKRKNQVQERRYFGSVAATAS